MTALAILAALTLAYAVEQRRLRGAADREAARLAAEVADLRAARDDANRAAFDKLGRTR